MNWMAWVASKHALMVHLPVAAALMIPIPIMAAQRGGRGIRPWWITCRYLAWAGLFGCLLAVVSGFCQGRLHAYVPDHAFWSTAKPGLSNTFWVHEAGGVASLVLAVLCLCSLFRERQPHQGIGIPALLLGLLWCASALTGAYSGALLERGVYSSPSSTSRGLPAPLSPPMIPSSSMRSMMRAALP